MYIDGSHIIWDMDDALSGLNVQYVTSSPSAPLTQGPGFISAQGMDPYRFNGYFAPGFGGQQATHSTSLNGLMVDGANFSDGSTAEYAMLIGGEYVNQVSLANPPVVTNAGGTFPHQISANATCCNCVVYPIILGGGVYTNCFLYSYNIAGGAWDIGEWNGSSFVDTFGTSNGLVPVTGSNVNPHPMIYGLDNYVYTADGNLLYRVSGATKTVIPSTTFAPSLIPQGYVVSAFAKFNQFLTIFCYYAPNNYVQANFSPNNYGDTRVYLWDYASPTATYQYPLNDNYVSGAFEWNGTIGCFTSARPSLGNNPATNRTSRLQIFDGYKWEFVSTFIGAPPTNGAIQVSGTNIQWLSSSYVFQYGSPHPGQPTVLNKVLTGQAVGAGLCKTFNSLQGTMICTGSNDLSYFNANYDTTAFVNLPLASPEFHTGMMGQVYGVQIEFADQVSGGLKCSVDLTGNFVTPNNPTHVIHQLTTVNSSNQILRYEYDTGNNPLPKFMDIAPVITWASGSAVTSAPKIKRIMVSFKQVDIEGD